MYQTTEIKIWFLQPHVESDDESKMKATILSRISSNHVNIAMWMLHFLLSFAWRLQHRSWIMLRTQHFDYLNLKA